MTLCRSSLGLPFNVYLKWTLCSSSGTEPKPVDFTTGSRFPNESKGIGEYQVSSSSNCTNNRHRPFACTHVLLILAFWRYITTYIYVSINSSDGLFPYDTRVEPMLAHHQRGSATLIRSFNRKYARCQYIKWVWSNTDNISGLIGMETISSTRVNAIIINTWSNLSAVSKPIIYSYHWCYENRKIDYWLSTCKLHESDSYHGTSISLCNKYYTRADITNCNYHNATTVNITNFLYVKRIYIPLRCSFYMPI